ncbi:MAG TPA: Stp1/IreP family PP2C-type Ser/Thr phosphatase [Clostridia bacterium]|nr:Stp1/IreP family PP2C-type Ser/Thr phosphatase [Clostridia bacterium]HHY05435.1 Stp1/IreP family PP2C-type Ser/Thr phosphatase [Clostridia bacterium]
MLVANALSEVGHVRKDNEDNYLVSTRRGLFVVADGMGGHAGGEVASGIVKRVLDEEIEAPLVDIDGEQVLLKALLKANSLILEQGQDGVYFGMGTTVTAALFQEQKLFIAHIGDSRAYLFREGDLHLLTQDHSLVNELVQKGELTPEEAENHPRRNILTRALGISESPQIDVLHFPVQKGDLLLLCTDGLYNQVHEEELADLLAGKGLLRVKVEKMVNLALQRGGNDNITAVLVQSV